MGSISLPQPSSSPIPRKKYDVYLSCRREDTRKNFTDHLYAALRRSGIISFRDDDSLETGKATAPAVLEAIQDSLCSIIVISEAYVFSSRCLNELAQIVNEGKVLFPVFYHLDPSDVRRQTGKVEEAFANHEKTYEEDKDTTQKWRSALTQVANISGWLLLDDDGNESAVIDDIIVTISAKILSQTYPSIPELIGINSRLNELHSIIDIGGRDVRVIGICGMGGIGKTTLARVVYTQMSPHFDAKCFLADVREVSNEVGLVSLQKQLLNRIFPGETFNYIDVDEGIDMITRRLSGKKVLLIIDNVDDMQQLNSLVGRRGDDHNQFGLGSRIIITTRDEHLLRSYQVDGVYKPKTLNVNESLELFSLKAFNNETVPGDFVELSQRVVEYADGLPFALKVLGSLFRGRDGDQWRAALARLESGVSVKEIIDRLKASYDGLAETEQHIFLDIACFFDGKEKDFVIKVLDACGLYPEIGINVLIEKSLLGVDQGNRLQMHNLLKEMGRIIARQKSVDDPSEKRCRLCNGKGFHHKLPKNKVNSECLLLPINLILEILLLALQQCASPRKPIFSLIAMILSFVAMFICIIELFGRGRKAKFALKRQSSIRCQFQPQSLAEKPTYSYIDMFVSVCSIFQFIFSIVAYYFHQLRRENPIKVSVVSIIFIVCTALSNYIHSQNGLPLPFNRDHDV